MAFLWPFRYHFLGGEEEDTYYMAAGEESFSPQNKQSALGIFLEPNDSANIVLYRDGGVNECMGFLPWRGLSGRGTEEGIETTEKGKFIF
jgi:hypothetical protein